MGSTIGLRTPTHKRALETEKVEQVADEWTRGRVVSTRLAVHKAALEAP